MAEDESLKLSNETEDRNSIEKSFETIKESEQLEVRDREIILLALRSSPTLSLTVDQIYNYAEHFFPERARKTKSWKSSIRHGLSTNNKLISSCETTTTYGSRDVKVYHIKEEKLKIIDELFSSGECLLMAIKASLFDTFEKSADQRNSLKQYTTIDTGPYYLRVNQKHVVQKDEIFNTPLNIPPRDYIPQVRKQLKSSVKYKLSDEGIEERIRTDTANKMRKVWQDDNDHIKNQRATTTIIRPPYAHPSHTPFHPPFRYQTSNTSLQSYQPTLHPYRPLPQGGTSHSNIQQMNQPKIAPSAINKGKVYAVATDLKTGGVFTAAQSERRLDVVQNVSSRTQYESNPSSSLQKGITATTKGIAHPTPLSAPPKYPVQAYHPYRRVSIPAQKMNPSLQGRSFQSTSQLKALLSSPSIPQSHLKGSSIPPSSHPLPLPTSSSSIPLQRSSSSSTSIPSHTVPIPFFNPPKPTSLPHSLPPPPSSVLPRPSVIQHPPSDYLYSSRVLPLHTGAKIVKVAGPPLIANDIRTVVTNKSLPQSDTDKMDSVEKGSSIPLTSSFIPPVKSMERMDAQRIMNKGKNDSISSNPSTSLIVEMLNRNSIQADNRESVNMKRVELNPESSSSYPMESNSTINDDPMEDPETRNSNEVMNATLIDTTINIEKSIGDIERDKMMKEDKVISTISTQVKSSKESASTIEKGEVTEPSKSIGKPIQKKETIVFKKISKEEKALLSIPLLSRTSSIPTTHSNTIKNTANPPPIKPKYIVINPPKSSSIVAPSRPPIDKKYTINTPIIITPSTITSQQSSRDTTTSSLNPTKNYFDKASHTTLPLPIKKKEDKPQETRLIAPTGPPTKSTIKSLPIPKILQHSIDAKKSVNEIPRSQVALSFIEKNDQKIGERKDEIKKRKEDERSKEEVIALSSHIIEEDQEVVVVSEQSQTFKKISFNCSTLAFGDCIGFASHDPSHINDELDEMDEILDQLGEDAEWKESLVEFTIKATEREREEEKLNEIEVDNKEAKSERRKEIRQLKKEGKKIERKKVERKTKGAKKIFDPTVDRFIESTVDSEERRSRNGFKQFMEKKPKNIYEETALFYLQHRIDGILKKDDGSKNDHTRENQRIIFARINPNPNLPYIVSGGINRSTVVHNYLDGRFINIFRPQFTYPTDAAWSYCGKYFIVSGTDKKIAIVETDGYPPIRTTFYSQSTPAGARLSQDMNLVFVALESGSLDVYDLRESNVKVLRRIDGFPEITCMDTNPLDWNQMAIGCRNGLVVEYNFEEDHKKSSCTSVFQYFLPGQTSPIFSSIPEFDDYADQSEVKCLRYCPSVDSNCVCDLVVTKANKGNDHGDSAYKFTPGSDNPVVTYNPPNGYNISAATLAFNSNSSDEIKNYVVAGTEEGMVFVFDAHNGRLHKDGVAVIREHGWLNGILSDFPDINQLAKSSEYVPIKKIFPHERPPIDYRLATRITAIDSVPDAKMGSFVVGSYGYNPSLSVFRFNNYSEYGDSLKLFD